MLTRLFGFAFVALTVLNGPPKVHSQSSPPIVSSTSLIREEQRIVVDGIPEIWRLVWKSPPISTCGPEDEFVLSCPCGGFAYGEGGQLDLVRIANGREVEHFELTPFFEKVLANHEGAIVQRWEPLETDFQESHAEGFAARVRTRPITKIMQFADYNRDGRSTEFFLQTGVDPCEKRTGIVVGVTQRNPHLHAFGTILHPNKPLFMQKSLWEALLNANGPIEVLEWACADHGSDIESDMELRVTGRGIQAIRQEYQCTDAGNRGRLLRKKPL